MDYYAALEQLKKTLAEAYLIKNTSEDQEEVQKAIGTIYYIESEVVRINQQVQEVLNDRRKRTIFG